MTGREAGGEIERECVCVCVSGVCFTSCVLRLVCAGTGVYTVRQIEGVCV
jgi:hypothetical protein